MDNYPTTSTLPHHLAFQIILRGHVDDLDEAARKLHPHIAILQPVIYTQTAEDELRIFHLDPIEEDAVNIAELIPNDVKFEIRQQEGDAWLA